MTAYWYRIISSGRRHKFTKANKNFTWQFNKY